MAKAATPPATPPTITPVLLLLELGAIDGTMIIVERMVVVTTTPSAAVELEKVNKRHSSDDI